MTLGKRYQVAQGSLKKEGALPARRAVFRQCIKALTQADAIREDKRWGNFEQRPQHKAAVVHVVVRDGQIIGMNNILTKQHDV